MTIQQQKHLDKVLTGIEIDLPAKYRKGVQEHGGNIEKKGIATLIAPEIRAEAIDLIVYTDCLSEGLNRIREICAGRLNPKYNSQAERGQMDNIAFQAILQILDGTEKDLK